jgi:hypothetical protein
VLSRLPPRLSRFRAQHYCQESGHPNLRLPATRGQFQPHPGRPAPPLFPDAPHPGGSAVIPDDYARDGVNFSQYKNLVRTGLIETALAAVIITTGILRRQRRRMRRAARGVAIRA